MTGWLLRMAHEGGGEPDRDVPIDVKGAMSAAVAAGGAGAAGDRHGGGGTPGLEVG